MNITKDITVPLKKGEEVGKLIVKKDEEIVLEVSLRSNEDMEKSFIFYIV